MEWWDPTPSRNKKRKSEKGKERGEEKEVKRKESIKNKINFKLNFNICLVKNPKFSYKIEILNIFLWKMKKISLLSWHLNHASNWKKINLNLQIFQRPEAQNFWKILCKKSNFLIEKSTDIFKTLPASGGLRPRYLYAICARSIWRLSPLRQVDIEKIQAKMSYLSF